MVDLVIRMIFWRKFVLSQDFILTHVAHRATMEFRVSAGGANIVSVDPHLTVYQVRVWADLKSECGRCEGGSEQSDREQLTCGGDRCESDNSHRRLRSNSMSPANFTWNE